MIAFISSAKYKPQDLILCSLSPYFAGDLAFTRKSIGEKNIKKYIGDRRMKDYENYDFDKLAIKIKSKTYILYGTNEGPALERRINDAKKKINGCKLIEIKGAKHDISQENYQEAVRELITSNFYS